MSKLPFPGTVESAVNNALEYGEPVDRVRRVVEEAINRHFHRGEVRVREHNNPPKPPVTRHDCYRGHALLPTGERLNPRAPSDATYYEEGQTAYVVQRLGTSAFVVLTSFGDLGPEWAIGTLHDIRHDQTLRLLGTYKVCGVVNFKDRSGEGNVPGRSLPHWVFK